MDKADMAIEFHDKGCNCAQAVALCFSKEIGIDTEILFKMLEGFGAGMGGNKGICGALSGAIAVISASNSSGTYNKITKADTYEKCEIIFDKFLSYVGSTICHEIKEGTVSCPSCIRYATNLVSDYLKTASK